MPGVCAVRMWDSVRAPMVALCALTVVGFSTRAASAASCPATIANATRLALVSAEDMGSSTATITLYVREGRTAPWRQVGGPEQARLGENGLAWGPGFSSLARPGEARKRESDWRTPAGIYRIGRPFGFAASKRRGYVQIDANTVCVDDPKSPAYNTITTHAGGVHGERMRDYPEYRHGLFIAYPSSHAHPADSCIFIHILTAAEETTAGCIALPEARVVALQDFAAPGAVIAVLPRTALDRFAGCLP